MCLAIPGKVRSVYLSPDGTARLAKASFGGIIKEISLELVPEARVDDYVLVHVGVAIGLVDEMEAQKVYDYLRFAGELDELGDNDA